MKALYKDWKINWEKQSKKLREGKKKEKSEDEFKRSNIWFIGAPERWNRTNRSEEIKQFKKTSQSWATRISTLKRPTKGQA